MRQLILSEIWIYPIKSLGGIRLNSAKVFEKGLEHDRRWMLVDETGICLTQRVYPKMALFKLSINGAALTISYRQNPNSLEHSSILLNTQVPAVGKTVPAKVWDDDVQTIEVDERISSWFSNHLGVPCRLVCFPEENARAVDPRYKVNDEHVSLADAYPFLIIGQSSLDDLNERLKAKLPMNRFRPNFVVTGAEPFEEDRWRHFTIGNNAFVGVKPCARCAVPTINQDTAEKGIEPTATLATYRKRDNKVYFGQNLVAVDHKTVSVGDIVTLN